MDHHNTDSGAVLKHSFNEWLNQFLEVFRAWRREGDPVRQETLNLALTGLILDGLRQFHEPLHRAGSNSAYRLVPVEARPFYILESLIMQLDKLEIDFEKNCYGLMLVIARRRALHELYEIDGWRHGHRADEKRLPQHFVKGLAQGEIYADPESARPFERIDDREYEAQIFEAALTFRTLLAKEDLLIFEGRYLSDPPRPYSSLVQQLGPGWSSAAARKRAERLLRRLREYLRQRELL